jgi:hypothetical protein
MFLSPWITTVWLTDFPPATAPGPIAYKANVHTNAIAARRARR